MPIYQEMSKGKTTYIVVATAQINGKQVNRKRRNISSMAMAKRIEVDLKIELRQLKECPNRVTWNQWSNECLKRMKIEFKTSTIMGYQGNLNKWVNPCLGEFFLDQITGSMIHDLIYNRILKVGADGRRTVLKQIKRIFTMAVDEGMLSRNPAKSISVKVPEAKEAIAKRIAELKK